MPCWDTCSWYRRDTNRRYDPSRRSIYPKNIIMLSFTLVGRRRLSQIHYTYYWTARSLSAIIRVENRDVMIWNRLRFTLKYDFFHRRSMLITKEIISLYTDILRGGVLITYFYVKRACKIIFSLLYDLITNLKSFLTQKLHSTVSINTVNYPSTYTLIKMFTRLGIRVECLANLKERPE